MCTHVCILPCGSLKHKSNDTVTTSEEKQVTPTPLQVVGYKEGVLQEKELFFLNTFSKLIKNIRALLMKPLPSWWILGVSGLGPVSLYMFFMFEYLTAKKRVTSWRIRVNLFQRLTIDILISSVLRSICSVINKRSPRANAD